MKTIFTLFLSCFVYLTLLAQSDFSRPALYFNAYIGGIPDEDVHLSTNLSIGYQVSDCAGLGLSLGGHTEFDLSSESFSAAALQYRITPGNRFSANADFGFVLKYRKAEDCLCETRYIPGWYPYFKANGFLRPGKVIALGLGFFAAPDSRIEYRYFTTDIEGNPVFEPPVVYDFSMFAVQFTLGIQIN